MRDADVRAVVRQTLWDLHRDDPNTLVVEEMGIWSGSARIDIAVINGELHGIELKSARDDLSRLPSQSLIYGHVFDRVTLVVARNHLKGARQIVPKWWGLTVASETRTGLNFRPVRRTRTNPGISAFHLARLLWKDELLNCLGRNGGTRGLRSQPVDRLAETLQARLSIDQLREEVRSALKGRSGWLRQGAGNHTKVAICTNLHPLSSAPGG